MEPGIASAQIRALETLCERHSSDKTDVGPGHPRNRNREFQLSLASPPIGRGEGDPVRLACTRCSSQEAQTRRHQGRVQPHNPASGGVVRIQRKAGGDSSRFSSSRSADRRQPLLAHVEVGRGECDTRPPHRQPGRDLHGAAGSSRCAPPESRSVSLTRLRAFNRRLGKPGSRIELLRSSQEQTSSPTAWSDRAPQSSEWDRDHAIRFLEPAAHNPKRRSPPSRRRTRWPPRKPPGAEGEGGVFTEPQRDRAAPELVRRPPDSAGQNRKRPDTPGLTQGHWLSTGPVAWSLVAFVT